MNRNFSNYSNYSENSKIHISNAVVVSTETTYSYLNQVQIILESLACSNNNRNCFSDSPIHLLNKSAPFLKKNATFFLPKLHSLAKALAINVFPVPTISFHIDIPQNHNHIYSLYVFKSISRQYLLRLYNFFIFIYTLYIFKYVYIFYDTIYTCTGKKIFFF